MIKEAQSQDSPQTALLHYQTINEGFLPKLGLGFLESLYIFLIRKELVMVYKEKNQVLGFVSCALSSKSIMKRFLFSSPAGIIKILFALLKKPVLVKPLFETFRAPEKSHTNNDSITNSQIPETELLSISVSPLAQKGGIGSQLVQALEEELSKKGIFRYKVIAGEKLQGANRFYKKNGFKLVKQIVIHGNDISNVYIKEISKTINE